MMWTAISFFISHLVSLILRLYRREFKDKTAAEQLFAPYGRVMIMHIVVLFGAFFIEFLGSPIYAIVLLVVLKTAIDLRAHRREGRDSRALESLQVSSN
jgi:hypothetical protein